jgi:hypothetical protein
MKLERIFGAHFAAYLLSVNLAALPEETKERPH